MSGRLEQIEIEIFEIELEKKGGVGEPTLPAML